MYITQLEIDNFKSFGKKTKIPVFEGFTVISGPNGSGKSNIIDSILFCLALSSARGLRAERLTDLINLNTGKNSSEVSITFSDGTKIRRRIKRTPNGYYSYNYLNDRLCKQGDVLEYLAKYGIKPEGYNVVMQGDITRIMEMSDSDRRRIIDEIAGVAEFDKKRGQALAELEVVRERIEREEMLLAELARRLVELKEEREMAVLHRQLQERLQFFKNCQKAATLQERQRDLSNTRVLITDSLERIECIKADSAKTQHEIAIKKEEIRQVEIQISDKSGTEYLALLSRLEEAKGRIKLAEKTIVKLRDEKSDNLELLKRLFMDSKRAETRVSECTELVRSLSIDRSNLAMEIAEKKAVAETVERKLQAESAHMEGAKDTLFSLMQQLEEERGRRADLIHQQDMIIEKSRFRSTEQERIVARKEQITRELQEKRVACTEYRSCIERFGGERSEIDRRLSATEQSLFGQRSTLDNIRKELKGKERDLMRLEAQQQAGGGAGGPALEAILGMDGVYGTVAQLGKVAPEYATALDTAAGGRLRYIVVENDSVAAEAILYLKENRLGRLTFLPLNKIKAPHLEPLREKIVIDYAVNLLEYDSLFDPVFRLVFGATVVVDTLDHARTLMGKYRIVTLEGELLEKAGAMTGGSLGKKTAGFGINVQDEIIRLRTEIGSLEADCADLESAITKKAAESEDLRRQRGEIDEQVARYRLLIDEYGRRTGELEDEERVNETRLTAIQDEIGRSADELAALEVSLEEIGNCIASVTSEIDGLKKRLDDTAIPELTEELERVRRELQEAEKRLRNKEADIADAQRERQYFTKRLEELGEERGRITSKNQQIEADVASSEDTIRESGVEISSLETAQQSFSRELEGLRRERDRLIDEQRDQELHLADYGMQVDRLHLQIEALREKEISLAAEVEALVADLGEITTDLSMEEIEKGLRLAEKELQKIGAVNMLAIDEFDRVEQRVLERTQKKDVLSRERTNLIERIEHFEKMKFEAFMESYHAIDDNFRKIFARLTEGSGRLVLDSEEDPFSGGLTFAVQPRDKKVHLLSALSGGEKSLTTLAFIFSIQQYMPAPFYALDEIDMFLDASNVERIATLIKEFSRDAQSIIVSLRKPTIERADRIMGVTLMPDKNTYVTGVKTNA